MKLGCISPGVIRTFRYFRGCEVITDKNQTVRLAANPKGGLSFLFEINYVTNELLFTAAITREDDGFAYKSYSNQDGDVIVCGRDICISNATDSSNGRTFKLQLEDGKPLLDQVFDSLCEAKSKGEFKTASGQFLQTLHKRMITYANQNESAWMLVNELIVDGVVVEIPKQFDER